MAPAAQAGTMREDAMRTVFRSRGYSEPGDVERDGDTLRATAKQGDREVNLRIGSRRDVVTQQQASD